MRVDWLGRHCIHSSGICEVVVFEIHLAISWRVVRVSPRDSCTPVWNQAEETRRQLESLQQEYKEQSDNLAQAIGRFAAVGAGSGATRQPTRRPSDPVVGPSVVCSLCQTEFGQFLLEENESLKQAALLQPRGDGDSSDTVDRRGVEELVHKYRWGSFSTPAAHPRPNT